MSAEGWRIVSRAEIEAGESITIVVIINPQRSCEATLTSRAGATCVTIFLYPERNDSLPATVASQ